MTRINENRSVKMIRDMASTAVAESPHQAGYQGHQNGDSREIRWCWYHFMFVAFSKTPSEAVEEILCILWWQWGNIIRNYVDHDMTGGETQETYILFSALSGTVVPLLPGSFLVVCFDLWCQQHPAQQSAIILPAQTRPRAPGDDYLVK